MSNKKREVITAISIIVVTLAVTYSIGLILLKLW